MGSREEKGKFIFKDQSLTSAVLGDGGIYSSIEDLFKWDQALYAEKLVKSETLQQAYTRGILNDGQGIDYGFGWRLDDYRGRARAQHTGSTSGFRNVIQRYPEDKFTVIILTNRAEPEVEELANQLTDLFLTGE
jgi:CubicO group peptidase (beta-lactamase class C family)